MPRTHVRNSFVWMLLAAAVACALLRWVLAAIAITFLMVMLCIVHMGKDNDE